MPLTSKMTAFARSESGTATVEVLFWFVLMTVLTGLIVDATNTFQSYSTVTQSIQDGNRQMSIGRFKTPTETEAYIEAQLQSLYPEADAIVAINGNTVNTIVRIPWTALHLMGMLGNSSSSAVVFTGSHRLEWL
ncbi:hypothetical protein P6F26_05330 [Roseibacterium sp. SDUM158017]|uniref:TadE/TadG family type IV pilus assembly protein n=1 Tax=Roseicyclus salinarum TaxID=3036773 RepID=UPI002414D07C|nr:hypothetical protein [Roseibacterium sp. SDUM158017]MDG4647857.1 hypothetical protein [Roseibacterium sp. SDUM158017]